MTESPSSARRRPRDLNVDDDGGGGGGCFHVTPRVERVVYSPVAQLLNDIAYQWQKEQRRATVRSSGRTRRRRDDGHRTAMTTTAAGSGSVPNLNEQNEYEYDEAASAYWWTDVFLRHFVFDGDTGNKTAAADSDDLLFFVRRRHRRNNKHKSKRHHRPSSDRPRRVAYDTQVYRKQRHQQTTLLPISDPAVLWRHTVCLNTIVHRMQYTLTVAVCATVPRKSSVPVADVDYCYDENPDEFGFDDDGQDQEHDLQVLSRHVHTVYASTSGRRMDTDKGPRERSVYPAVCWAADDYAEAFRTVVVRPGQTVCTELVASWLGSTVVDKHTNDDVDDDDDDNNDQGDGDGDVGNFDALFTRLSLTPDTKNRAVLFSGAIPYGAVRATYECKMSLYRDAERRRRKRLRKDRKRRCGDKSSLGAALSASLTALFTSGKDTSGRAAADRGDGDYYYGADVGGAGAQDGRVEYVTVRGCRPTCDDEDDDDGDGADFEFDADHDTKGLAQMAVTLAPVQPRLETNAPAYDEYHHYNHRHSAGSGLEGGDDDDEDQYVAAGGYRQPAYQNQLEPSSYAAPSTASEPGDYYDYGWDYETAASSGHQTPQTPMSYRYQQQQLQQQQLERRRRPDGRPRRLSDPCSTSVYDVMDDDSGWTPCCPQQQQQRAIGNRGKPQQPTTTSYGGDRTTSCAVVTTPGRWLPRRAQRPHRAWSESDGLDRCGGGGGGVSQSRQQHPLPLPPPPVPYYCAADAAASGFVQYARKSAGGWRTRTDDERRRRKTTGLCGGRPCGNDYDGGSDSDADDGGGGGGGDSDGQHSDGEFIGTLAAAAAVGHRPEREWAPRGLCGDPTADWDRYGDDDDSDSTADDGVVMVEWTTEIVAADVRRTRPRVATALPRAATVRDDDDDDGGGGDFDNWYDGPSPSSTSAGHADRHRPQQRTGRRQQRAQQLPPLRPRPLEPPPPPPALSVAFTAVACPWWTVLKDLMLANAAEMRPSSSNRTVSGLPLLTFD